MTREVAIKAIQDFIGWFKEDSLIRKALEMAIKALEQNESAEEWYKLFVEKLDEQEPCTDAVSREAVYSILKEYHIDEEEIDSAMDECQNLTVNAITSDVSLLPSVTQKSGKWNEYYTSQKGNDVFNCKECGHTFVVTQGKDNMNFCPNCGACMKDGRTLDEFIEDSKESEDKE